MEVPEADGVPLALEAMEAAVEAKMWSQKGMDSSRSLPIPERVFFCTTGIGRVR